MKKVYDMNILKKEIVNQEVFKLVLERPEDMTVVLPGQFFTLAVSNNGYPLLKRPISVSKVEKGSLEFTIKIVGQGTRLLSEMNTGTSIEVLGPLGNGFFLDEITEGSIIVGGGIGVSPVKELARYLKDEKDLMLPMILGFRDEVYDIEEFNQYCSQVEITTESGKTGEKGFVTMPLERRLKEGQINQVLVCGPHPMLKAVQGLCDQYQIKTQLLMEERMACGIGACLVCTCAIKEESGISNKRVCKDGPVFYGSEVEFHA